MPFIDKASFTELAYNNYRDALLALYPQIVKHEQEIEALKNLVEAQAVVIGETRAELVTARADIAALQETVLELSTVVNAPAEE